MCLRTRARVAAPEAAPRSVRRKRLPKGAVRETRRCLFDEAHPTTVIDRARLGPGHTFDGPALIEEYSGTTLVPPGWRAQVSAHGHLLLTPA